MPQLAEQVSVEIQSGSLAGHTLVFTKTPITVGRTNANDISIPDDRTVSSRHARITCENGAWYVEDLGSQNGTFLETGGQRTRVSDKTAFKLGQPLLFGRTLAVLTVSAATTVVMRQPFPGDQRSAQADSTTLRISTRQDELHFELVSRNALATAHSMAFDRTDIGYLAEQLRACAGQARALSRTSDRRDSEQLLARVRGIGCHIRDHLLPQGIRERLEDMPPTGLFLAHTADVLRLPWELTILGDQFLCLRHDMGRQVVLDDYSIGGQAADSERSVRCLVVANPTEDLPEAQAHAEQLLEQIRSRHPEVGVSFLSGSRVQRMDLLARLADTDVVYYIGHAVHDVQHPENSGWILKQGRVTSADFRRIPKAPRLVFANGCQTSEEASWNKMNTDGESPCGLASGSLLSGVNAYLGALWHVPTAPALTFAAEFMTRLFSGYSVGESTRRARLRVIEAHGMAELVWAAYTLLGDPDQRIISNANM